MQINELPTTTGARPENVLAIDKSAVTYQITTNNASVGYLYDHGSDVSADAEWIEAKYHGPFLDSDSSNQYQIYLAGLQRESGSTAQLGTVSKDWVKTYLGLPTGTPTVASSLAAITQVTSEVVNQPDITIGNSGWAYLTIPASGTPLFAIATYWSGMANGHTALAIVGSGSTWYLTGTPGVTVTGLKVRYFFIG